MALVNKNKDKEHNGISDFIDNNKQKLETASRMNLTRAGQIYNQFKE